MTSLVNNAKILVPNVLTENGVFHIIDQVLNPGNPATTYGIAFASPTSEATVPFTSNVATPTSLITTISAASSSSNSHSISSSLLSSASTSVSTSTSGSSQTGSPGSTPGEGKSGSSSSSSSHTNVGAVAGGVVGGIVGLILIALLIWWCRRKGYSLSVKLDQKSKSQKHSIDGKRAVSKAGIAAYNGKPESPNDTTNRPTVTRKELPASAQQFHEASSPIAHISTGGSSEVYGTQRGHELSATSQTDRSMSERFIEVESGFGPVEAEYSN